jgi:hypothetical protein
MKLARLVILSAGAALLFGCSANPVKMMQSNEAVRTQVMTAIAGDSTMVGSMTDALLNAGPAREILLDKVMGSGEAMQAVMGKIARDPAAVDGIVGLAVQDSAMKAHLMTLLKGIQMGSGAK